MRFKGNSKKVSERISSGIRRAPSVKCVFVKELQLNLGRICTGVQRESLFRFEEEPQWDLE